MKNRIRELREEHKYSQEELAKVLGTTRQAISLYETGQREPKLETWQKLAEYFEVSIPYLQGIELTKKEQLEAVKTLVLKLYASSLKSKLYGWELSETLSENFWQLDFLNKTDAVDVDRFDVEFALNDYIKYLFPEKYQDLKNKNDSLFYRDDLLYLDDSQFGTETELEHELDKNIEEIVLPYFKYFIKDLASFISSKYTITSNDNWVNANTILDITDWFDKKVSNERKKNELPEIKELEQFEFKNINIPLINVRDKVKSGLESGNFDIEKLNDDVDAIAQSLNEYKKKINEIFTGRK